MLDLRFRAGPARQQEAQRDGGGGEGGGPPEGLTESSGQGGGRVRAGGRTLQDHDQDRDAHGAADQLGDEQLEGNVEYRFKMFRMLNGALFVDAGNIWLTRPNPSKPGADFQPGRFYKEIAIGSGAGLRADFSFFVIRFDVGLKVRDPEFTEPTRWVIGNVFNPAWKSNYKATHNNRKYSFLVFNIGINYPF